VRVATSGATLNTTVNSSLAWKEGASLSLVAVVKSQAMGNPSIVEPAAKSLASTSR
jgi:hypothetical protein